MITEDDLKALDLAAHLLVIAASEKSKLNPDQVGYETAWQHYRSKERDYKKMYISLLEKVEHCD
jgi:hypothetical protein